MRSARPFAHFVLLILAAALGVRAVAQMPLRRNLELQWEQVEGATLYEIELQRKDQDKSKPMRIKTKEPQWTAGIKAGNYTMRMRSYDRRGVPGEWSPLADLKVRLPFVEPTAPKSNERVVAQDRDEQKVRLAWQAVPGAEKYHVSIQSTSSAWKKEEEVSDTSLRLALPVAESFAWTVVAIDPKGEAGEVPVAAASFQLDGPQLKRPSLDRPASKYVSELHWSEVSKSDSYSVEVSYKNPQSHKWEVVDRKADLKSSTLNWDISRPSGVYRLKVQAHGAHRDPSSVATMTFTTRGGFGDREVMQREALRDSFNKPTLFYAIASYMVTTVHYAAANHDTDTAPAFAATGGTGRVGLGYQDPESNWGGFAIGDMSGFNFAGSTYKFASAEGHLTHKLEFGQSGLLLIGAGLFYKQLPILTGSPQSGLSNVGQVSEIGPHLGFTYWIPFTQRIGLQANARVYYALLGGAANAESIEPSLSYQYGLLGSYRLSSAWMGYAGFAYRHDEANYKSNPSADEISVPGNNSISINGTYLNLMLEFSF
jgi:hypothetical protein